MKYSIYLAILSALLLQTGCKKDPNKVDVTFEGLGDVRVNNITGFAFNGDPLCYTAAGSNVRWQSSNKQWERVGSDAVGPVGSRLYLIAEDKIGTYYAKNETAELFELTTGSSTWQSLNFADGDTMAFPSFGSLMINSTGDMVVNIHRQLKSGGERSRVYRRAAGNTAWVRLNDRPADDMRLVQYLDNGEIFLQEEYTVNYNLYSLKAAGGELQPVFDCTGTVIKPYCGLQSSVSSAGEVYTFQGGLGTHIIYRAAAKGAYPITASEGFFLPDEATMTYGIYTLKNGSVLTYGNNGGNEATGYYVRSAGASSWKLLPEFPGNGLSISIFVNRQGQLFSHRQQLGFPNSEDLVYRVNY
ncbi:MAG TPA: hypothetical protein VLZ83_13485 [Edaphocola sp.]|nr:hypothetical protein [Edaphocola sp.]